MKSMCLVVEFYARLRELVGEPRVLLEVPAATTLLGLRRQLSKEFPKAAGLMAKSTIAVNEAYAEDATVLQPGDRIAVLPPVSGG